MVFSDHVFATKSGVELELRVFRARGLKEGEKAPWLFWSHGGAFLFCYHLGVTTWAYQNFLDRGYHIVSWAYRLAPIASVADMVSDGQDAFDWCRANLETTLANTVDVDAYVVGGDSAGGCLATLLGGILTPPPRAVLDDQGITDLSDPWFDTHPDPVVPYSGEFTDDEIAAAVAERDPSKAITGAACPNDDSPELETEAEVRASFQSSTVRFGRAERLQLDVRRSICSKSAWVRATVHPEKYGTEDEVKAAEREWSSLYRLDRLSTYPPTFFLHGDSDECVPVWQSRKMAAKLREMAVEVGEHYEPGVGHCFNHRFTNDKTAEGFDNCVTAPLDFIDKHVKRVNRV